MRLKTNPWRRRRVLWWRWRWWNALLYLYGRDHLRRVGYGLRCSLGDGGGIRDRVRRGIGDRVRRGIGDCFRRGGLDSR